MEVCPICGGSIRSKRKLETFEYKGRFLTLELTVYTCNDCGEEFYDGKEMEDRQKIIKEFLNKAKARG